MATVLTTAQRERAFGARCKVHKTQVTTPWGDRPWVHDLIVPVFLEACATARHEAWKPRRIDSYACRSIRGSTSPSLHSWALATDWFATDDNVPPPGGVWEPDNAMPAEFARHFIRLGFRWGAFFTRRDVPHLEWPFAPPGPRPSTPIDPEEAVVALNKPACKILVTPDGGGYAIVAQDGGVFTFGNAEFFGSAGGEHLNAAVIDAEWTPDHKGYYLLGADGGVFTFGSARFHGSPAG